MIAPPPLQSGDKAGICAPAGKIKKEDINHAVETLRQWQLKVICSDHLFFDHDYFSGTDEQRLQDLQSLLDDPEIRLILFARGGYGSTRIIDKLDFSNFFRHPKWIVGFSDLTALHGKLQNIGYQSIHALMANQFGQNQARKSIASLQNILFDQPIDYQFPAHSKNISGKSKGLLTGGNLSILENCIGTSSDLNWQNKILFIEEIDEPLYKLDRILTHFMRIGKLQCLNGLLAGHFTAIKDTETPFGKSWEDIILEKVNNLGIPVAFGMPAGHAWDNFALKLGTDIEMQCDNDHTHIYETRK